LTRCGTFIGPFFAELVGYKELTKFKGGFCGNQFKNRFLDHEEN
jgi:hypothetical protein